jgi:hypothetical protein
MTPVLATLTVGIATIHVAKTLRLLKSDASGKEALAMAIDVRSLLYWPAVVGLVITLVAHLSSILQAYLTPQMIQGFKSASWSFIALFIVSFFLELFVALRHERHCDAEEDERIRKTVDALKNERAANDQVRSET